MKALVSKAQRLRGRGAALGLCALLALFTTAMVSARQSQEEREPSPVIDEAQWTTIESHDGSYRVRYRLQPEVIEFGELFSLELEAERIDGEAFDATLAVDARMPEHAHGMNREPQLEERGKGSYSVTNLFFHMPGYWEIYFDFTRGAITERAQFPVDVD